MIGKLFFFALGVGAGVYIAQNYYLPDVRQYIDYSVEKAKGIAQDYKKPE